MTKYWLTSCLLLTLAACGGLKAPRRKDGSQMTLYVLVDSSATQAPKSANTAEAAEFLGSDLSGRLGNYEWDAHLIKEKSEAKLAPGALLATIKMTEYRKGDATTRAAGSIASGLGGAVGTGGRIARAAAQAHIKIEHMVTDDGGKSQCSGSAYKDSTRSWQDAVAWVSKETARLITKNTQHLNGKY